MQSYSSKSQKRSQSKSKNGGRRRKRTLKNVRRRKSRKVMRGGAMNEYTKNFPAGSLLVADILNNDKSIVDRNTLDDYVYSPKFNTTQSYIDLFKVAPTDTTSEKGITNNKEAIVNYLDSGGKTTPK